MKERRHTCLDGGERDCRVGTLAGGEAARVQGRRLQEKNQFQKKLGSHLTGRLQEEEKRQWHEGQCVGGGGFVASGVEEAVERGLECGASRVAEARRSSLKLLKRKHSIATSFEEASMVGFSTFVPASWNER